MLILLAILSIPIGVVAYFAIEVWIEHRRPTYYESAANFPLDDLPTGAHEIRFMPTGSLGPWGRTYEFRCTEDEYLEWVGRTRILSEELGEVREEEWGMHPAIARDGSVELEVVENYLVSDWTFEDQGFYLVYDRKNERAIRWSHSR
ncbi:MAG: hypothetical protein O3A92_15345 [Verrucomicrobia bacterium]|nr:hypothetical protein [Verrucomicrobiota bacterium]